jgi:hypothetical protein
MGVCGSMNFFERDRKKERGSVYVCVRIGKAKRGRKGRRCVW